MDLSPRAFLALVLCVLFFGGPLYGKEKADALLSSLPETIAECRKGRPQDYGDARLGNSIDYDRDDLHITVYAYDLGNAVIASGISDPVVKETFESARKDIQRAVDKGLYAKARALDNGTSNQGPSLATLKATFAITSKKDPESEFYSEIHVYGARNYIIKLRISTNQIKDPEIAKTVVRFVPELMNAVASLPK